MAVITLTEAKVFLQISDTSKDALITALIPIVDADIQDYCNITDTSKPGLKIPASSMIAYLMNKWTSGGSSVGKSSEAQGGYSYTNTPEFGASGGYPATVYGALDKYRMARIGTPKKVQNYRDTRGWTAQELVTNEPEQGVQGADYSE
jgi:hypothetical protein